MSHITSDIQPALNENREERGIYEEIILYIQALGAAPKDNPKQHVDGK